MSDKVHQWPTSTALQHSLKQKRYLELKVLTLCFVFLHQNVNVQLNAAPHRCQQALLTC